MSKVISGLIKFFIQLVLFLIILLYYVLTTNSVHPNIYLALFPVLVAMAAMLSFSMGIIITAMTTKYRDMTFLVAFGVNLMFYATPVIYPVSRSKAMGQWLWYNPLTSLFEAFKYGFFGKGVISWPWLAYSAGFTVVTMLIGIVVFNNVERKFIDTV
jgi:lipopolysaccharide transport system permease protein